MSDLAGTWRKTVAGRGSECHGELLREDSLELEKQRRVQLGSGAVLGEIVQD